MLNVGAIIASLNKRKMMTFNLAKEAKVDKIGKPNLEGVGGLYTVVYMIFCVVLDRFSLFSLLI